MSHESAGGNEKTESCQEVTAKSRSRKRVLLIAYHFPPAASSSGHLRTLGFMQHLPELGWEPVVLSAHPRAYVRIDKTSMGKIPSTGEVYRAFALDSRQHISWRGKHISFLALPDRWVSWWPGAVYTGLKLIRAQQIDAIWSTYPIATAHLVALSLCRYTGLPWIADFRDPMQPSHDTHLSRRIFDWLERRVMHHASLAIFTTQGARHRYAEAYPDAAVEGKLRVISNGFEEELFASLPKTSPSVGKHQLTLLHSGLLYPEGRNPIPFFRALAKLKSEGRIGQNSLNVILRASGNESEYNQELDRLNLSDIVSLKPPVSYEEALREQARSDGLLLFQGEKFNTQIPAKVYEYLRIGRPIFALIDSGGDTGRLLSETGGAEMVSIKDEAAITNAMDAFLTRLQTNSAELPDPRIAKQYSRQASAECFAAALDAVVRTK